MPELNAGAEERIHRILVFLAVAGGAALLSRQHGKIIAGVGEIDRSVLVAARSTTIEPPNAIVHVGADTIIANVGLHFRLLVRVPGGLSDRAFAERLQRAIVLLTRFVVWDGSVPSSPPPSSAPAQAVMFLPDRRRSR